MFYFVTGSYCPNTAPNNRIIAYINALSKMGIETEVVFLFPDKARSVSKIVYPHVNFTYLWKRFYINIPKIKSYLIRFYLHKFVNSLDKGDIVYVYGYPDLVMALSTRRDIRLYSEITEHPQASFVNFINHTSIQEYLECLKNITGIVVISDALKNYFIEKGCNPERVHVINMIVDKTRFKGLKKEPQKKPYIAYCGTASNTKDGVDQLIKAFSIVVNHHPEYDLFIIGSTPSKEQRFDNLELVKKLGISNNVVFTGIISAERMPQMLKNASILALDRPNNLQAKFGFPTKLGEYLLTSNPVVITNVGDIPLFLKDGVSALISQPENPNKFAEKVCWAIEHPELAKQIGEEGRLIAESCFDYMEQTKKLVKILKL